MRVLYESGRMAGRGPLLAPGARVLPSTPSVIGTLRNEVGPPGVVTARNGAFIALPAWRAGEARCWRPTGARGRG